MNPNTARPGQISSAQLRAAQLRAAQARASQGRSSQLRPEQGSGNRPVQGRPGQLRPDAWRAQGERRPGMPTGLSVAGSARALSPAARLVADPSGQPGPAPTLRSIRRPISTLGWYIPVERQAAAPERRLTLARSEGDPAPTPSRPTGTTGLLAHLWMPGNETASCGHQAEDWQRLDRRRRTARDVELCTECSTRVPNAPEPAPARPSPTIPAAQLDDWETYLARLSGSAEFSLETRRAYASRVAQYLRWLDDRSSTSETLQEFCGSLAAERRAGRTVNAYLTAIANFHRFTGPAVERPAPITDPGTIPDVLRPAEVAQLGATIAVWSSARDQAILRLLLGVGLRTGELTALNCGDVVMRPPNGVRLSLASGRSAGRREFDLPATEFRHLVEAASPGVPADAPLFANNRGERLSSRAIAMLVNRAGMTSGLVGLNPRMLRQTAITDRLTAERDADFELIANVGTDRRAVMIREIRSALAARSVASRAELIRIASRTPVSGTRSSTVLESIRRQSVSLMSDLLGPIDRGLDEADSDLDPRRDLDRDDGLDVALLNQLAPALPIESGPSYLNRLERFVQQHGPELVVVYHRLYRRPGPALLSHDPIALIVFERFEANPRLLYEVWRRSMPSEHLDDLAAIWRRARRLRHHRPMR